MVIFGRQLGALGATPAGPKPDVWVVFKQGTASATARGLFEKHKLLDVGARPTAGGFLLTRLPGFAEASLTELATHPDVVSVDVMAGPLDLKPPEAVAPIVETGEQVANYTNMLLAQPTGPVQQSADVPAPRPPSSTRPPERPRWLVPAAVTTGGVILVSALAWWLTRK